MAEGLILALDMGTSAVKAGLYTRHGRAVARFSQLYPTVHTENGGAEQDPGDLLTAAMAAVRTVVAGRESGVIACAVTGQMAGLILLDAWARPLGPCLTWQDRRAEAEAAELAEALGLRAVYEATGGRPAAMYPAAKLKCIQRHQPELWRQAHCVTGVREYIMLQLTGRLVTDPSCAGSMQLFDIRAGDWWGPVLAWLGVSIEALPAVQLPWEIGGRITPEAAQLWRLPAGVPVAVGAGDGPCASLSTRAVGPGDAVVTVGTSGVVRVFAETPLHHPAAATTCYGFDGGGQWLATGVTSSAGAALDWAAQVLGLPGGAAGLAQLIGKPSVGAGGAIFLPWLEGERTPFWQPRLRAGWLGLTSRHRPEHLARAAVEGVGFSLRLALEALEAAGAQVQQLILTGGATRNPAMASVLAGALGRPAAIARASDATLGAACLAAVAVGVHPDIGAAIRAMIRPTRSRSTIDPEIYSGPYAAWRAHACTMAFQEESE